MQNEETINTSFENNPCRKIFAFSVSKSKEVYFWKIFSENQKSWTQGLLLSMEKIYALSVGAWPPPTIFFIFLYFLALIVFSETDMVPIPKKIFQTPRGQSKSATSMIFS